MDGQPLAPGAAPPLYDTRSTDNWAPFEDDLQFLVADFLYRCQEMSQGNINILLHLWGLSLMKHGATHGPYENYQHIFDTIDNIEQGDAPWMSMAVSLNEDLDESSPSWKRKEYEVWYRDPDTVLKHMLSNPDFNGQFDYQPYVELDEKEQRRLSDFMSANVAWNHSVCLPVATFLAQCN